MPSSESLELRKPLKPLKLRELHALRELRELRELLAHKHSKVPIPN